MIKGFTLIELIAVVFILAVLFSISVPRLAPTVIWKVRAYSAAQEIATKLLYTRSMAITSSRRCSIKFIPPPGPFTGYEIWKDEEGGWVKVEEGNLPENVEVTGSSELIFEPLGNPTSGGEITVSGGDHIYIITLDPIVGRVEVSGG